jgi:hypothetical protein
MHLHPVRLIAIAAALLLAVSSVHADVVTEWNVIGLKATETTLPQPTTRAMAIVHGAMFDAINAITPTYTSYLIQPNTPADTSQGAAGAAAAHGVLEWLFPEQKDLLQAALRSSLSKIPDGAAKDHGVSLGQQVAAKYIATRRDDGANLSVPYTPGTGPGAWCPTPPDNAGFALVGWAGVTPFVLETPTEVRAPGPPPLDSAVYLRDIDEVRRVGGRNSQERTADQTAAAIFSLIKSSDLWNAAARAAVTTHNTSLIENARIFALLNMAMTDAGIAGWTIKKQYARWRPITAIRAAQTNPDPNWEPLLITPPHPDYISGHCITSGSAARLLSLLFHDDGVEFSATFGGPLGVTRSFTSFTGVEKEIGDARVWAGIHTRCADDDGNVMGHQIAEIALQRLMKPLAPPKQTF